jgi:hypothetical protein
MKFKFLNTNDKLTFYTIEDSSLGDVPLYDDAVPAGFPSPADDYLDMSYDQKHELQQFVFPKGATYNKENDQVRTPETHLLFELTKRTTGLCENKKSGTLSQNEMDSALVDLSVLISNFYHLNI